MVNELNITATYDTEDGTMISHFNKDEFMTSEKDTYRSLLCAAAYGVVVELSNLDKLDFSTSAALINSFCNHHYFSKIYVNGTDKALPEQAQPEARA